MMKKILNYLMAALLCAFLQTTAAADDIIKEMDRVAGEVAALKLGFGSYILGTQLTEEQKKFALQQPTEKSLEGTYKFRDKEIFIIAAKKNDVVLGVYKHYPQATMATVKDIVGTLMFEYGEPTAVAHDKMVYWSYNSKGKISQADFDFSRQSGGMESLAAVKFSSSERIADPGEATDKENGDHQEPETISAYVMITSDPLSKLFLAHTTQGNT